jgi:hypothetical protein
MRYSNNVLMELRKTLCHPYIISPEIEPRNVTPAQEHANLTEASAKFVLLASMLPKLHAAGHRVLIVRCCRSPQPRSLPSLTSSFLRNAVFSVQAHAQPYRELSEWPQAQVSQARR